MTANGSKTDYDALVVGAGVGGMESALTLGDMGFKVLVVEKEPSVGGRMILLSKVFPTLDCASCISTPKMAAVNNHPNVRALVYSEVDDITPRPEGGFLVHLTRKPTFVDAAKCTGCALCEAACTVAVPDEFNYDLAARRPDRGPDRPHPPVDGALRRSDSRDPSRRRGPARPRLG